MSTSSNTGTIEIPEPRSARDIAKLGLGALGVVYGDIGTSPLYTMKECFRGPHGVEADPVTVLGVLSLVFWALTTIVVVKYISFVIDRKSTRLNSSH